ncbi:mannitol dehydrogenase family protein [Amycolatopsis acididurans]|uniref:mannitol dehydrogenase family protein n=1 Tax=Amycolatopsis acididurans TaxID=2724524 RepID=UPI0028B13B2D|nr:mannitol dehydrogenase family protein [Amycolatopsis acididurans]
MSALLSCSTVDRIPAELRPLADPAELRPRIVHFGLGAFHRAHQAVYTEAAAARTGQPWGIVAVGPRSAAPVEAARAQDCLFSVTDRVPGAGRTRVVGSVLDALRMREDAARIDELIASPQITTITLTVTEKGYTRDPATGLLDTADPDVAADLAATAVSDPAPMRTVAGRLTASLAARFRRCGAPVNVVSCDNAAGNGAALAAVVRGFAEASAWPDRDALLDWLAASAAFPATVVDRIVPASTGADRAAAEKALGVRDETAVAGEPFRQWVLEDRFAADRPAWETDGALVVPDAAPYQLMKLRLLNGSHSLLAYLGLAAGCGTVAEAVAADWGERAVRRFTGEVTASLPGGLDVAGYVEDLITRFANPAIAHRLRQIGSDGSLKILQRWLGPLRERGVTPMLVLALAAWVNATRPGENGGQVFGTADPAAVALARCWQHPDKVVTRLLMTIGAADLAEDRDLVSSIQAHLPALAAGRVEL